MSVGEGQWAFKELQPRFFFKLQVHLTIYYLQGPHGFSRNAAVCQTAWPAAMKKAGQYAPHPLNALVFFAWVLAVQLTGLAAFTKGFFLTRVELGRESPCDVSDGASSGPSQLLNLAQLTVLADTFCFNASASRGYVCSIATFAVPRAGTVQLALCTTVGRGRNHSAGGVRPLFFLGVGDRRTSPVRLQSVGGVGSPWRGCFV